MAQLAEGFKIIDADTHYTEPYDLWTSRAPKGYENRVLHMEEREGLPTWVVDGNEIGFARGGGVVARDSSKLPFLDSMEMGLDWVHEGAFDPQARLKVDGRNRGPRPGPVPQCGRPRWLDAEQHDPRSALRMHVPPDLQRRHGRDDGSRRGTASFR